MFAHKHCQFDVSDYLQWLFVIVVDIRYFYLHAKLYNIQYYCCDYLYNDFDNENYSVIGACEENNRIINSDQGNTKDYASMQVRRTNDGVSIDVTSGDISVQIFGGKN